MTGKIYDERAGKVFDKKARIARLIQDLGGTAKVAAVLGVSTAAVRNARRRGILPPAWYIFLQQHAIETGYMRMADPDAAWKLFNGCFNWTVNK